MNYDDLSPRAQALIRPDQATGCWNWAGKVQSNGYPVLGRTRAHRLFYEAYVGPAPIGADIDHVCETKHCVNPAHLEAVTHRENVRRIRHRGTPMASPAELSPPTDLEVAPGDARVLADALRSHGTNPARAAIDSGIPYPTVTRGLRTGDISATDLFRIARVLGVPASTLFAEEVAA